MEYKNSLRWIGLATIITLATVLFLSIFEPEPGFPGIPSMFIGVSMILAIIGLLTNEVYQANQYRVFNKLFSQMIELGNPLFRGSMYRRQTEAERDAVINKLVALSDNRWNKFLVFCEDVHPFRFSEFDHDIIKDIEMVRALK